jgi:cytochrome subunit of sulfide dehydrogenase
MIERETLPIRNRGRAKRNARAQIAALVLIMAPLICVAAQAPNGEALGDACTSCHGIGGHSKGFIPSIAGVNKATLLQQLMAYRAQSAPATIMNRIARAYTDSELEALAGYFSSRPGK